jgi:glutamate synthase (NADPH/NADH) large chain
MGKSMENFTEQKNTLGLYDPQFEHDACGIGAVVDIKGRKSHQTVDDALAIVERLEHRAGFLNVATAMMAQGITY